MKSVHLPPAAALLILTVMAGSCGGPENDMTGEPSQEDSLPNEPQVELPSPALESVQARHILIAWDSADTAFTDDGALAEISALRSAIVSGDATFEDMAREYSQCWTAEQGGLLPVFTRGGIDRDMEQAILALQPGEVSEVVRTRFGYHIFKRVI